jgi:hypothetical protein
MELKPKTSDSKPRNSTDAEFFVDFKIDIELGVYLFRLARALNLASTSERRVRCCGQLFPDTVIDKFPALPGDKLPFIQSDPK